MLYQAFIYASGFAASLSGFLPVFASGGTADESGFTVIHVDLVGEPPGWASAERRVIESLNQAGIEFYDTYVDPRDNSLPYKERYEGGMNSSDDMYEAFRGFSLHTLLGGSHELDRRHRMVWEGITRQYTRYGQIYREFDSNWDWMHHGEGYVSLYPMGMVEPHDPAFRDRAVRFAAMYIGDDPEAPNYDPELKLMRASMNGSRGPKMEWTKRDWIPTNTNLVYYGLPFDDIPGIDTTSAWINDHPDNDLFAKLVKAMSDRMAKGDVPINLTSTPLIANAYLYTGDSRYVDWVRDYVGKWEELTERNGGITPDNVGLSDKIGEYTGNWWGGYYGWMWVRGGFDIIRAELTAAKVATLLTGDTRWAELPRSQMAVLRENREIRDGVSFVPVRHDERGWHHFEREPAYPYLHLWFLSQSEEDWQEIERLAEAEREATGGVRDQDLEWAYFVKGRNPGHAERAFSRDLRTITLKLEEIRGEQGDPSTWSDSHWLAANPMQVENLTRLSLGALPVTRRGEMLHSQVRYFDDERRRAGLPPDVAAIVTRIEKDWIEIEIVNLNALESRQLIIQGGAYGEHRIHSVDLERESADQTASEHTVDVNAAAFMVDLAPGAGSTLTLQLERYANQPSYDFPWNR